MPLIIKPVTSEKLAGEVYDAEEFVLYLLFPNGGLYAYGTETTPFAPEVYAEFIAAPSKGKFFIARISGPDRKNPIYPFRKLGEKGHVFKIGEAVPFYMKSLFITDEDIPANMRDPQPRNVAKPSATLLKGNKPEMELSTTIIPELPSDPEALVMHARTVKQQVEGLTRIDGIKVALVVTDAQGYESAANLLVKLKAELKIAQARVDAVKKPAYEEYQRQLAWEKEVVNPYKTAIDQLLEPACTRWRQDQREAERQAEQQERARQQKILDEEARVRAEQERKLAEDQAAAMEAAGQPEVAQQIREAPAPVIVQQAAPVVMQTAVPKVQGLKVSGTWKFRITDPLAVPRALVPQIIQAMHDHGYGPKEGAKSIDSLAIQLGRVFCEYYTLDESKIGAKRTMKEAAVGLIPGVEFYFDEKTTGTGNYEFYFDEKTTGTGNYKAPTPVKVPRSPMWPPQALPSAADLDAIAEEQSAKEWTSKRTTQ